jgi:hypothetical protein
VRTLLPLSPLLLPKKKKPGWSRGLGRQAGPVVGLGLGRAGLACAFQEAFSGNDRSRTPGPVYNPMLQYDHATTLDR